jgi:CheY-like chemotaxis protein
VPGSGATFSVELPFITPPQVEYVSAAWPRPMPGEKVLLVLDGAIEAALLAEMLVSVGAAVARVPLKHAEQILSEAAVSGSSFTTLIADRSAVKAGAGRLVERLATTSGRRVRRAAVLIDPADRAEIPEFRADGFNFYLMRPVRPLSLLTQLFATTEAPPAMRSEAASPLPLVCSAHSETEGASVLLAEDNDINALLACTVLEKAGARVVRVRNGAEAIERARNELNEGSGKGFDLVFMDIHMPGLDGIEAARRIRALYPKDARPAEGRPPIVALTASVFAEDRATYLAAGLDDYLAKPFEKSDLAALFARWRPGPDKTAKSTLGAA